MFYLLEHNSSAELSFESLGKQQPVKWHRNQYHAVR